jgi:NAD+ diphosphatase
LVFLGVDERSAPESSKSLPLSKPTDTSTLESHSPHGIPHWALDVSRLSDLKKQLLEEKEGREFVELRAGSQVIPNDEASIGAEARSLIDWNTRNKVSISFVSSNLVQLDSDHLFRCSSVLAVLDL